jgi:uncharacterized protein YkwD
MLALPLILAVNVATSAPGSAVRPDAATLHDLAVDRAVLAELNRARTAPDAFAASLAGQRAFYHGNLLVRPGQDIFETEEGVAPVDEAIAFVRAEQAGNALLPAPVLAAAAADHQAEQQQTGEVGHVGPDGSTPYERVRRRGGDIYVGELITYGTTDPADIVRQLAVDDGVADRGHRQLMYDRSLRYAGVACGPHPVYRYMCVVTLGRTPDGEAENGGI